MKQIVIMPGGFHPFHAGHYALYKSALEAFPQADVYVAATNDQSERPFPFSIKEKLAKLAGVAPGRFVQVKSPFQSKEITQNYNPEEDVLIFVRSEKDRNEQPKPGGTKKDGSPAYFQPWTGKNLQPFSKHAYMAYLPTVTFGPGIKSATEIRNAWPNLNDKQKMAMVMSLYPSTQKNVPLAKNVAGMFDQIMGPQGLEEGEREALQFATQAHAGQKRSGGEPYIAHPVRVADHVRNFKQSHNLDALISAAYLHDTVEDTDTTHEALHDLFGGLVASLVKELTSDPEEIKKVGKAQYLAHKMAAMSSYALVIKLADRLDNVKDITTARTPQWRQKYKNETEHILNYIEKTRALSGTHQKLIGLIREKLKELDDQENVSEAVSAAQQAAIAINMKKHHKKPKVNEVGDQPYQAGQRWRSNGRGEYTKSTTLPDGRNLEIVVEYEKPYALVNFYVDSGQQQTGKGDAYKIFSTVGKEVNDFVGKYKPDILAFTASMAEESRVKLYDRFADRMVKSLPNFSNYTNISDDEELYGDLLDFADDRHDIQEQILYVFASPKYMKEIETMMEDKNQGAVAKTVVDFYKPIVKDIHKEKLPDYVEQARELMHKADPATKQKLLDIFKKGKENPYLQGGIITTVGALLAGGILNTSQSMGLTPQQTNIALQAILNTVIPTLVSRINGRNWKDTIKYTLASAGVGTGIATITENQDYLEEK